MVPKYAVHSFNHRLNLLKLKDLANKWDLAPFIPKASLSSPSERNRARSAFLTVFLPYSHRLAREPDGVGRRVCLSGASYGAAEKSEWRMALKI